MFLKNDYGLGSFAELLYFGSPQFDFDGSFVTTIPISLLSFEGSHSSSDIGRLKEEFSNFAKRDGTSAGQNQAQNKVGCALSYMRNYLDHFFIRDLDQIHADLRSTKHLAEYKNRKAPEDLPGLGKFYCVECAKWFEGESSLEQHRKGKVHKRRSVPFDHLT
jgi:hypothetical protein